MAYDPSIYQGTATHYRSGRPPYSAELEAALSAEVGLDGTGRLLDAGCGPGILAVRLAPLFADVVGLDPDRDMLAEGRRAAETAGVANVTWVQARAEDLPDAAPGPYRLVTFGQSFHWTDEHRVADVVYEMLEPGGALALIVHTHPGRPVPPGPGPPPIPHDEIRSVIQRYLGSLRRAGQGTAPERHHRFEDVLGRSRFVGHRTVWARGRADLVRDSQGVLDGFLSMSFCAPHLFGDRLEEFTDEVLDLLRRHSPDGVFWDWPGDTEIILAVKPAATRSRRADGENP